MSRPIALKSGVRERCAERGIPLPAFPCSRRTLRGDYLDNALELNQGLNPLPRQIHATRSTRCLGRVDNELNKGAAPDRWRRVETSVRNKILTIGRSECRIKSIQVTGTT